MENGEGQSSGIKDQGISLKDKFNQLAGKYKIATGLEISIKKIKNDPKNNSAVESGKVMTGTVVGEIGLGKNLALYKNGDFAGNTSEIINIGEKDGHLQFLTQTNSVYELIPKKNKIEEEIENHIERYFYKQPKTTKDILTNNKELFVSSKRIDNKTWFFTAKYGQIIMALVNSDEDASIFYPRFFRISESDHQFKALPGYRANKNYLKGKENDENHHYVQSAKLDSQVILTLQELPKKDDLKKRKLIYDYLPVMPNEETKNDLGKNTEDLKFSEEQVEFKNKDWQQIKEIQKYFLKFYEIINNRISINNKNAKEFYKELKLNADNLEVDTKKMVKAMESVPNKNDEWLMSEILSSNDPYLINLKNEIDQVAQNVTEEIFTNERINILYKRSNFIPDFNKKPMAKYIKTDGKDEIKIEVFINTSHEGDILCWEMATDNKGRIYIDNIYDPTVGIDNYGTPKKKTNMGMLIYKPEDYYGQVYAVPEKYTKKLEDYVDISSLFELSEPIKMYKKRLKFKT